MEDQEVEDDGTVPEQLPVRPQLRCQEERDLGHEMGAPAAISDADRLCRNAIILSLYGAMIVGTPEIHYPRNRNTYSRSWLPEYWTYRKVMRAIADLTVSVAILVEHRAPSKSPRALGFKPKQSTLSAGPGFKFDIAHAAVREEGVTLPFEMPATSKPSGGTTIDIAFRHTPGARIRLRDGRKREKLIPVAEPIVGDATSFLSRYDLSVEQARIEVRHPDIFWLPTLNRTVGYAPAGRGRILIDLSRRHLVRIFSRDMRSGGRWYHAFWQEMPRRYRKALWIDGAPTVEHDFSACHLRLAYYAAGAADALAALGAGRLYALPGYDESWRTVIKRGVNIMFNANSLDQARRALARELDPSIVERRLDIADEILATIKVAYPALERFWHSGCGIGLQFVDSEIVRLSIERLLDQDVLALPMHDSLLVAEQHKDVLIEVMEHTFATEGRRIALERFAGGVGRRRKTKKAGLGVHDLTNGRCEAQFGEAEADPVPVPCGGELVAPWLLLSGEPAAVLSDLTALVTARQGWSKPIIRAALHMLATGPGGRSTVRASFNAWQATVSAPPPAPDVIRSAFNSFFSGTRARPTATAVARRCGIDEPEAARLNLVVLRPLPSGSRREAMAKRARRMAIGGVPLITLVNNVKPWLDIDGSRSGWYARTTEAERQVLALQSIVRRGDNAAIDRAAVSIAEAKQVRRLAGAAPLPVDDLLAQLEAGLVRAQQDLQASRRLEATLSSVASFNVSLVEIASSVLLEGPHSRL